MMIMAALRPPLHQRAAAAAAPVARWSTWPLLALVLVAASVAEAGVLVGSAQAGGADLAGYSTSTWDSSPFNLGSITDNNLGVLAKSCSDKFCRAGVDGLDLWVSFEEVCTVMPQPYFAARLGDESGATAGLPASGSDGYWHPVIVGALCAAIGVAGVIGGFSLGTRSSSSAYCKSVY
ncbi:expressed unknown protein [Ectocarpus siliculosus]|uniref:Uncharacterized protein n=1 Tax=Ectocarpus siliculosus TaxID=2880 RepID=D8LLT3_ECTSI|nr:expressed unknown protein [Ectocarpus siliculosus]|eukprot:CBN76169.1 expressed unknown protein [Ectocarpus siliculosus]